MRQSKRSARRRLHAEMNVVPYIDVMLVLLVIFMITTPLLSAGVEVNLPKAAAHVLQDQQAPIIVSVDAQGLYYLNIAENGGHPLAPSILASRVKAAYLEAAARPVLVKADSRVSYAKVIDAMTLLQKAGVKQVGLVTEPPKNKMG